MSPTSRIEGPELPESLLTVREVAEILAITRNSVKRLGDKGEIPFYRIGSRGDRRHRPEDVRAYLNRGKA